MGHKPWDRPWKRAEKAAAKRRWKREVLALDAESITLDELIEDLGLT